MIVVIVVDVGAGWEAAALARLSADPGLVVLKRCVDVDDLLATASTGQAEVAVVGAELPGLDRAVVDALLDNGVRVVAVAQDVDATRSRAARIGLDGLVPADRVDELPDAIKRPAATRAPVADELLPGEPAPVDTSDVPGMPAGRVIAVWGPTGAPGRTTTAIGLASELARRGLSTVLVDADPWSASVAQHLGVLDEVSGLLAAARHAASGTLAQRYAEVPRRLSDRLHLVTGLPRPDRWREVRPGTLEDLVACARRTAQVVVDTGFSLEADGSVDVGTRPERNGLTREAIAVADEVVVVGAADPVGLARLARAIRDLSDHLDHETAPGSVRPVVRVVVNRMRPSLGWREADVTSMLAGFGAQGVLFLPDDQAAVDRALVAGRSLVESGESGLTRAHAALVDAMAGLRR
jgi:MinD-like ATPase involved in chromosome partitioning or flagellar assembly